MIWRYTALTQAQARAAVQAALEVGGSSVFVGSTIANLALAWLAAM